jgi:hypothetical protein
MIVQRQLPQTAEKTCVFILTMILCRQWDTFNDACNTNVLRVYNFSNENLEEENVTDFVWIPSRNVLPVSKMREEICANCTGEL